jgi:thiol-disulfide isomerase/thioredoxin
MRMTILAFGLALAILPMPASGASAAAGCAKPPSQLGKFQPAKPGTELPAASFVDADGHDQPLDGLRDEALVLNIWATWCAPCVEEMPALDRLAAQAERIGVRVLPLSADREGASVVRRFYAANNIHHLPVALDKTARVARATGVGGLPTTLLYDKHGNEFGRVVGVAKWDAPEVVDFLATCLAGRA